MTLSEFKAWLEGFEDGREGKAPTGKQWKRIKEKLDETSEGLAVSPFVPVVIPFQPIPWSPPAPWPWYSTPATAPVPWVDITYTDITTVSTTPNLTVQDWENLQCDTF